MSQLSFMEKLLGGAVTKWLPLKSLCGLITTGKLNANAMEDDGIYPFFTCKEAPYKINTHAFDLEAILISGNGSQVGHLNYYKGKFNAYQRTYIVGDFQECVQVMYLFHYLKHTLKAYITQNSRKGSVPYITMPMLENFQIPIPCPDNPKKSLEIQAEIVRILDTFTELTTELTTELNARKKQYNYYRDQLLSFEEGDVEWKTLGWIGEVRMCKRIMKNQTLDAGDIPFFKIGTFGKEPNSYISREIFEEYRDKYNYPNVGEVLISASGTIGRAVIFDGEDAYFQDSNIVWLENDESKVLNKFLFYFYQIANWNVSDGGVIKRLYNDNIKKTSIPIPYPNDPEKSLAEQARIVAILDKFDALINSITEGLPREIELRQKQYEYYRDLLLSFPKPDTEAAA
ncbi:putative type I restriction enzyme specificity protein [Marinomonas pontica]|uniref:Type I restriction enzyme specificity protein n=1 Tax=Marinomonas pontica TaxID=264739 RepID=A0ABM8F9N1_9GAMM|nr:putative type I restriction enzyme specificity protein [Marinomonas pontica]BDX01737.1 putative type I restriction enzyme specificity protein [Marinomonas pontica]